MGNQCFKCDTTVNGGAKVEKRNFEWKVENPRTVFANRRWSKSQGFEIEAGESLGSPSRWELRVWRNVNCNRICVYIRPTQRNPNVSYTFKLRVVGSWSWLLGSWPLWLESEDVFASRKPNSNETYKKGQGVWIDLSEVLASQRCVVFQIKFKFFVVTPGSGARTDSISTRSTQRLKNDLAALLESGSSNLSDFKLIAKDSMEFEVHRAILSARSPVFEAMFRSNMKEQQTGSVQLDDLSSKTLKLLLHFMYTGSLPEDWSKCHGGENDVDDEVIDELSYAADKYMLEELTEMIKCSSSNACCCCVNE